MTATTYETAGGIRIHRTVDEIPIANAIEPVVQALDAHRGVLLASSYEYPGRYTRWDMGFVDPPLALTARNRDFRLQALNARGRVLLAPAAAALRALDAGDLARYEAILAPTLPLSRHVFKAPTRFYKTGVVFAAYLNGHQSHFRLVGGLESARSVVHLAELFVLADRAGILRDPEVAAERMRRVLAVAGVV